MPVITRFSPSMECTLSLARTERLQASQRQLRKQLPDPQRCFLREREALGLSRTQPPPGHGPRARLQQAAESLRDSADFFACFESRALRFDAAGSAV